MLNPERLGDRHMHVADVTPVPDGLEDRVREAQGEHVLNCLLAHVMVDPVDLGLFEAPVNGLVESLRGLEVPAEGLLDHKSCEPASGPRPVQPVAGKAAGDLAEERRDGREVEDPVAGCASACYWLIEFGKDLGDLLERRVIVVVAAHVAEALDELGPSRLRVGHRREAVLAKLVLGPLAPGDTDENKAIRQRPVARQRRQRGQELARGQVAGRAEHHERQRRRLGLSPLGGHQEALSLARTTACPPNWLRKAASSRRP